ncbi:MAG: CoA-binding protein [Candidatus Micrarchaeota archaeon]|nr:CoA-binding protein [Candidatus Micrarchaeota archaeon]
MAQKTGALAKKIANLEAVFNPSSIAVIGASREPNKIGHVIVKNFIDGGFAGRIYPINPNADEILGLRAYKSVLDVKEKIDSAVIAIPAQFVAQVLEECGKKGIKGVVLITGGFSEVGKHEEEKAISEIANRYGMALIGPNCMGVITPASRVDSVFLPIYKLGRPRVGPISFISQSGAVGGCIVDLAARAGIGMCKFVSYGNAAVIDECDLLEYLGHDKDTQIIVVYLEGVKDGRRFLEVSRRITRKKPIVAIKAGRSAAGAEAAKSHTGSLAGSSEAYRAAFKQAGIIEAATLEQLFDFAKVFDQVLPSGKRVGIITNGGGMGVLAVDSLEDEGLELASISEETAKQLRASLPPYANVRNPLDIIGDADSHRYEVALNAFMKDSGIDVILLIILFQTAAIDSSVVNIAIRASDQRKKPIIAVCTGGEYTEMHKRILESYGVPTYSSPSSAMRAISRFIKYAEHYSKYNRLRKAEPIKTQK